MIPTAAVQRGAPGTFVYLVKPDSTVAVRTVKLGPRRRARRGDAAGLAPGDRVVVDGADKLRDGAKVVAARSSADAVRRRRRPPRAQRRPRRRPQPGGARSGRGAGAGRAATAGRRSRPRPNGR